MGKLLLSLCSKPSRDATLRFFLLILFCGVGAVYPSEESAEEVFERGQAAEARLDLFGARADFRRALEMDHSIPGLLDHTAWFYYLNGFHNQECLRIFEECLPKASDPDAVRQAISQLREEMGLDQSRPRSPTLRPARPAASPTARLQYARELFWSGAPGEASVWMRELLRENPQEAALHWELARVLIAMNKFVEAGRELQIARELRPNEPEIALEQAKVEALRGRRTVALRALRGIGFPDAAALHLARARSYHYAGEFLAASAEYRQVLAERPFHEIAAHGLAETSLRTQSVPEARALLKSWPSASLLADWSDRVSLEREVAAPRALASGSLFTNNLTYRNWNAGADFRFRPIDSLEVYLDSTHGWFLQEEFAPIERQTAELGLIYQATDVWAASAHFGVNGYNSGWTSVIGGFGLMVHPTSTLEVLLKVDHMDVVDSEPPLGISLYDLAATIGAVGGRATMDILNISAMWKPVERLEFFGKYKLAVLTGESILNDYYVNAAYSLLRSPLVRVGYGFSQTRFSKASLIYQDGANSTSLYYDPQNLLVQNYYAEFSHSLGKNFAYGAEVHFYQQPINGGVGSGLFAHLKYSFAGNQSLRIDLSYFSQDRGLNRDGTSSAHYESLNAVASYEFRF
jgi:thioredoxin-like negative regulator of GroEL